jgi:hypothetical protein
MTDFAAAAARAVSTDLVSPKAISTTRIATVTRPTQMAANITHAKTCTTPTITSFSNRHLVP